MRIVKWLLGIVVVLAVVLVAGGYALSSKFHVARSVKVEAPPEKVYALVADPREWKRWSVWNQRDPAMQIAYSGPASGPGAKWEWKSTSQGDGAMTFTRADPGKTLGYDLYFPDFGTTSTGEWRFAPDGTGTRVTWTMDGDMGPNPLFHWMALMGDRMVGSDFEAGLANLKALAERP